MISNQEWNYALIAAVVVAVAIALIDKLWTTSKCWEFIKHPYAFRHNRKIQKQQRFIEKMRGDKPARKPLPALAVMQNGKMRMFVGDNELKM
jgi:hypothetical protein